MHTLPFRHRRDGRIRALYRAAATTLPLAAALAPATVFADWPQFRGPGGMGHAAEGAAVPLKWSEDKNVAWKTAVHGRAWSSPIVLGRQVWLTTATPDGKKLSVLCVDADSGEIVHDKVLFEVAKPQFAHKFNTYASPTPAAEKGRVYVTFGSPGTACLDAATGKVLWERTDFVCDHFRGAGSSPIIHGDLLILPFDGADFQFVAAMDKRTGKTVWKTERSIDFKDLDADGLPKRGGDFRKAYSTPLIARAGGREVLFSVGSSAAYAYEPDTGKEIWRTEERTNHSGSARPVFGHGLLYVCTGLPKGRLWAIDPTGKGHVTETHRRWEVHKGVPSKPSILLIGDLLYMVDDGGIVTCLQAADGEEVWKARIEGNYSASPLYASGRIYFFDEEGRTTVIKPGRTFEKLAVNRLEAGFMASPAVDGDALILRTRTHLYRIEESARTR